MRRASTTPSATSPRAEAWVASNTLEVLLAHRGQVVDVEEAPVGAGGRVDVEEPLAQPWIGPETVAVVGGHVVGDEVEHDAQPGGVGGVGQRAEGRFAAEVLEIRVGSTTS